MSRVPVVEAAGVTKAFGDVEVLQHVDLEVFGGRLFGLIGPSGCGKTTLIRLMIGLSAPTEGTLRTMGQDPLKFTARDRERIGYTAQGFLLYPNMTVWENARFVAGLYGVGWRRRRRRTREVLEFLELWEARDRLAREISGGMQRRLSLACALIHEPELLFIDEPTAGLDPVLRIKIWEYLQGLRQLGTTILVTTQYIDEAIHCDTVAFMKAGEVKVVGTPDELQRRALGGDVVDVEAERFERDDIVTLWEMPGVQDVRWNGARELRLTVDDIGAMTAAIPATLAARGTNVLTVKPHAPSFEEVFLALVGDHRQ